MSAAKDAIVRAAVAWERTRASSARPGSYSAQPEDIDTSNALAETVTTYCALLVAADTDGEVIA